MARGVDGRDVFIDERDRTAFLQMLKRVKLETNATIYAYCLMGNHFHLAIKVALVPLSSIMQRILTCYSLTFNHRHERTGHLFQARYKSLLCLDDRYLLSLIRYIQMNPVRAGLVANALDWPWSSRSPVELPNLDDEKFDPWRRDEAPPVLARHHVQPERSLDEIGENIATLTGIARTELQCKSKRRKIVAARISFSRAAVESGHRIEAVAAWLNAPARSVSYYLAANSPN